jgi:NAD(P)H-flavin reductase
VNADIDLMVPTPYRVIGRRVETHDSVTLDLAPVADRLPPFRPGQFTMLYARGVGEIAVSVSGDPSRADGIITQTIRDVGAVSRALHSSMPSQLVGVRGPFGTGWGIDSAEGRQVLIVAGGVGLAPLRPVLLEALRRHNSHPRITLVAGARSPSEFLFADQLDAWAAIPGVEVVRTIDRQAQGWTGDVGFVTEPLGRLVLDPGTTTAFICGPEPMMRLSARVLIGKGMAAEDIRISLERNMKCGVGLCGHCQLGPLLLCRDGPVVDYAVAGPLLDCPEL